MPKVKNVPNHEPDLTSVRTLITSVSKLANHLKLTNNAIYRWIKVNRIPGEHVIKVAQFYDVEVGDLIQLTGSDLSAPPNVVLKQRDTLPTLIKVKNNQLTLSQASELLGQKEIGLRLILTHWGDQLELLYDTLLKVELKLISLDEAANQLGVAKYTLHGIRRKYGFAPGALKRSRPKSTLPDRKRRNEEAAIEAIKGRRTVVDIAEAYNVSTRTVFRAIEGLTDKTIHDLADWPINFRDAFAEELQKKAPKFIEKWLETAKNNRLFIKKETKYPKLASGWREAPLLRMLLTVLLGEHTLQEICALRRAEPVIMEGLFDGELKQYELTYSELMSLPLAHQLSMADIITWTMDRKRKV